MKWIKQTSLIVVLCISATAVLAAPVIEEPAVMPEALFSITVSDLHGLIDGIGSVAAQASPMMNGMMIKSLIGMQLGDPNLAGIAPGKGLAIVALDATNLFAVIEVSEAQSTNYSTMATSKGLQSKFLDGVLVLGKTSEMVGKGAGLVGAVQSKLLAKRSPTLRIAGQPAAIVERNNDQIQGFLQMMPVMMGAGMLQAPSVNTNTVDHTTKILEGEVRVLLSIVSQCESGEVVIAPEKGSIRINETYVPKAGTRLAKLGDSLKTKKQNPTVQSGILSDGDMVQLDFVLESPEALSDFIMMEMNTVMNEMEIKNADLSGLMQCMEKWMKIYGGSGCETFDFDAEDGMSVNYLLEVADEAAALAMLKSMEKDMAPFMKLYEEMDAPMKIEFKENSSEHKGIKIHRLEMDISLEDMPAEQRQQFDAMDLSDMDYDIAIFDGLLLYTMGEDKIKPAIDRIKDPATTMVPLKARSVYPADGFYYCDIDVGRYVEFIAALMPDEASSALMPQVVAMMQGVDPITSAGFREDGRVMWSVNIPGDLIGKLGQLGMMMQMQKMQQQQPPQHMPPTRPSAAPVQ